MKALNTLILSTILSIALTSCAYASCSRDVTLLDPILQEKLILLKEKANERGIEFIVICGYRSQSEQDDLYAIGRTKPGNKVTWVRNSQHSIKEAIDIAVTKKGSISWKGEDYYAIGEIGKAIGLNWGGDWKVRDYGHFQL